MEGDTFSAVRQIVQHAIGHGEVIEIHPLDMAEILMEPAVTKADLLSATVDDNGDVEQYVIVGKDVYHQTVHAARTGTKIN